MDYTSYHKRNVLRFEPYNRRLEKGMIIENWYVNLNGEVTRQYLLVLNPRYRTRGEVNGRWKMHAIKLNKFPPAALNLIADTYGIRWAPNVQRYRQLDVSKLVMEISSQRYYRKEVMRTMKRYPSYRIYFLDKVQKTNIIDYKFPDYIENKYLVLPPGKELVEHDTHKRHNIDDEQSQ